MQQLTQSLGREGNSRFVSSTAEIVAIQANIGAGHRMVTKLGHSAKLSCRKMAGISWWYAALKRLAAAFNSVPGHRHSKELSNLALVSQGIDALHQGVECAYLYACKRRIRVQEF